MALVHDPELLIDEPTTGERPWRAPSRSTIMIREFRRAGAVGDLPPHYIEEAEQLRDRVIVLRSGEVVADGTPLELVQRAGAASTLWIACSGPSRSGPARRRGCRAAGGEGGHYRFIMRDPAAADRGARRHAAASGADAHRSAHEAADTRGLHLELVGDAALQEERVS